MGGPCPTACPTISPSPSTTESNAEPCPAPETARRPQGGRKETERNPCRNGLGRVRGLILTPSDESHAPPDKPSLYVPLFDPGGAGGAAFSGGCPDDAGAAQSQLRSRSLPAGDRAPKLPDPRRARS